MSARSKLSVVSTSSPETPAVEMGMVNGMRRALSASLALTNARGDVSHDWLLDGQPVGDLRLFLLNRHAPCADGEIVEDAFRNAGGTILLRTTRADGPRVDGLTFVVDTEGRIGLRILGGGEGTDLSLRIAIPHSSLS